MNIDYPTQQLFSDYLSGQHQDNLFEALLRRAIGAGVLPPDTWKEVYAESISPETRSAVEQWATHA